MPDIENANNENSSSDANTPDGNTAVTQTIANNNNETTATKFASPTNKAGKFYCQICDVTVNSEIQLQQVSTCTSSGQGCLVG